MIEGVPSLQRTALEGFPPPVDEFRFCDRAGKGRATRLDLRTRLNLKRSHQVGLTKVGEALSLVLGKSLLRSGCSERGLRRLRH